MTTLPAPRRSAENTVDDLSIIPDAAEDRLEVTHDDEAAPARAPRRPRRSRRKPRVVAEVPQLGSLTQRGDHADARCAHCDSSRVTRLRLRLTDGTDVTFTSCHRCEERTWRHADGSLSVETVLDHARTVRS